MRDLKSLNFCSYKMTIIVLTGAPEVGKTIVVTSVARKLQERGVKVGGIVSREIRDNNNMKIGFGFIDLIRSYYK